MTGVFGSLLLALLAWPLLTGAAQGPGVEITRTKPQAVAAAPTATIERVDGKVILVGSVAELFNTGSFSGPNRAEKVNRARLTPDGVTISSGFDAVRTRLAELRSASAAKPGSWMAPRTGIAGDNPDGTPIQVASIDPRQSAALGAIDQVVPMAPTPMMATPSLAYARETTAPTPVGIDVDKYGHQVSSKDIRCMAEAIYFEARGESYRGQVAVGQVVMNRLAHPIYPKDICQVVFQNQQMRNACQFSFACDGIPETINDPKSWQQADAIARGVISGSLYLPDVGKATHYHANYVYPDWAPRLKRVTKIGHHIFYQFKRTA